MPQLEFPPYKYNPVLYNQNLIHGEDITPRPYSLDNEILSRASPDATLLDIGCGPAQKLFSLAKSINTVIAIDKNPSVVTEALQNVSSSGLTNIHVMIGNGNQLPIQDQSVDIVTYMLCPHNVREAWRVLKHTGYVIADRVGEHDKSEIKDYFKNKDGSPRGYRSNLLDGEIARIHKEEFENTGFEDVSCQNMFWKTRYTKEELWLLLNSTPTIKDFHPETDRETFDRTWSTLTTSDKITITQHRVLVIAKK